MDQHYTFDENASGSDQQRLEREGMVCPKCGTPLPSGNISGRHVHYRCIACGRKYRLPASIHEFFEYRERLNNIYADLGNDRLTKRDQQMYKQNLNALRKRYPFAVDDPQYYLLSAIISTKNDAIKHNTSSRIALRKFKNITELEDGHMPLDTTGKLMNLSLKDLIADTTTPKWVIWAGIGGALAVVLAVVLTFCLVPRTPTVKLGDISITPTLDNDSYGAFGKWGKKFEARELDENTMEYKTASILLKNESEKYRIFDMSVLSGTNVVQPKKPVRIEMTIPEDYVVRNLAVYYISPDGKYEVIESTTTTTNDKSVVIFYAEHFSLYAIAEHPFNVDFSADDEDIPTQKVMWGENVSEPAISDREGYTFLGWYDGDEKWDFANSVAHKDVTLVAKWSANEYKITYNYNDGRANKKQTVTYGEEYILEAPTRVGYLFDGWYDENSVRIASFGDWFWTSNMELYAKWSTEAYRIRFDADGGSISINEKGFTYGEYYGDLPTPTRPGFRFEGWYTEKNGGGRRIESTSIIDKAESHTIYASWEQLSYTVRFESNGGTSVSSQTLHYGDKVVRPGTISKDGFEFLNWYKDSSFTMVFDFDIDTVTADMTLYARWGRGAITIIFDTNGGGHVPAMTISQGDSLGDAMPDPKLLGSTFDGWYKDPTLSQSSRVYASTTFTANTTLYAKWRKNTYNIKYDPNGGAGLMSVTEAVYGSDVQLAKCEFTYRGYKFAGWATSPDASVVYKEKGMVKNLTAESGVTVTLYAKWDIATYQITYVTNGGVIKGQTTKYTLTTETINIPDAVYESYGKYNKFLGWFEDENCTIAFRNDLKENPRDIQLYAGWDKCDLFDSIDETPLVIKTDNPLVTSEQRIIIDWSKENDTNLLNHTGRDVEGTGRYNCIEIPRTAREVIIIGSAKKTYSNLNIKLCGFMDGDEIKIVFENFSFSSVGACAIESDNDNEINVNIKISGKSSISGTDGNGSTISLEACNLFILGDGELSVIGGIENDGYSSVLNGSCAVESKNLVVDMTGTLNIQGGNGRTGNNSGSNGGDGGIGVKTGSFIIKDGVNCNIVGGNGANGKDVSSGYYSDGGAGGNGAIGVSCQSLLLNEKSSLEIVGGSGGEGGQGAEGRKGNQGKTGPSAVQVGGNGIYNSHNAGPGGVGGPGGPGYHGGKGGNGACALSAVNGFENNSDNVHLVGGSGGDGGKGGEGGEGGQGGTGGADDYGGIGTNAAGRGGDGGVGGTGGDGGKGGNNAAAMSSLTKLTGKDATLDYGSVGKGGEAGDAGVGGARGKGGSGGANGSDGGWGYPGKEGKPGKPGDPGKNTVLGTLIGDIVVGEITKLS